MKRKKEKFSKSSNNYTEKQAQKKLIRIEPKIEKTMNKTVTIETKIVDPRKMHTYEYREFIMKVGELINNGEVIVFPTETVYGLGANAFDSNAVSKIFSIKNRPNDNPLIVHVSSIEMMKHLVDEIDEDTEKLINKFWPGPLTVILRKNQLVPEITTAKLDTVAIRMPNHPIALDIIKASGTPIAAPSANISGRPSATNVQDAFTDLNGKVPLIINGGDCKIGIESTVINMTSKPYMIVREGYITKEQIEETIEKEIEICKEKEYEKPISPGMKYKHYSPDAKVLVAKRRDGRLKTLYDMFYAIQNLKDNKKISGRKEILVILSEPLLKTLKEEFLKIARVVEFKNNIEMARSLFKIFRNADRIGIKYIIIEGVSEYGIGRAIMERIQKAADEEVKEI